MEILEQKNNKLLHREEVGFLIESNATPSAKEILKLASEKFKKPEENIVISYIKGNFGKNTFSVFLKIYDSAENKSKYEVVTRKQRKKEKKEAEEAKKAQA